MGKKDLNMEGLSKKLSGVDVLFHSGKDKKRSIGEKKSQSVKMDYRREAFQFPGEISEKLRECAFAHRKTKTAILLEGFQLYLKKNPVKS